MVLCVISHTSKASILSFSELTQCQDEEVRIPVMSEMRLTIQMRLWLSRIF